MGTHCQSCGALLAPNAAWCFNCLQAVPGVDQDQPHSQASPSQPTAAPPRPPSTGGALRPELRTERPTLTRAEYSRWKKGPTSFGPATKIALTVLVVAMLPFGGALGMQLLYAIAYVPFAMLVLWGLWRKQQVD